jgi:Dolichyl-phosphate-mannose-protein mannosyltransferase
MLRSGEQDPHWRSLLRWALASGVLIAIVFNAVIFGLHLWSKGGQKTVVEIDSLDGAYRAIIDGSVAIGYTDPAYGPERIPLDAPEVGSVAIYLPKSVPSLPRPSGVDSVVILDHQGRELFRDDFDDLNNEVWRITAGSLHVEDGVLVADQTFAANTLAMTGPGWRDYRLQVTYQNSKGGAIGTHVVEDGGVFYHFELIRDFPMFFDAINHGGRTAWVYGDWVHADKHQLTRSLAAMVTRPYPYVLLGIAVAFLLTLLLSEVEVRTDALQRIYLRRRLRPSLPLLLALGLALAAFLLTLQINSRFYDFVPHLPDEVSYMFQAKLLASGRLMADIPPAKDAFYFYSPPFLYERGDQWASAYPFGHPLTLAVGEFFGQMKLVPSVVGATSVALMYGAGSQLYNRRVALLAALLFAGSPFFLMQSSSFMSHNTAVMYILAALFFTLRRDRPLLLGLLGGICFGLALNTRPLSAVALAPPFAWLLLSRAVRPEDRTTAAKQTVAFLFGGLFLASAMLAYNSGITGDPLNSGYAHGDTSQIFGFSQGHTLDIGLRNEQAQLTALLLVLDGWPAIVGLGFVLAPFLLGTRNRYDYLMLACAVLPMTIYIGYRYSGVYEGPRYWYEAVPFLILLTARGAEAAGNAAGSVVALLRERMTHRPQPQFVGGTVAAYVLVLALFINGSGGWLFDWAKPYDAASVPYTVSGIQGIWEVDGRLNQLADETQLTNALVLVKPCGFFSSGHCYGSVFLRNSIEFDGDVVWARYMDGSNHEIIAAFPGRSVYVANWDGKASIEPYQPSLDP